MVGIVDGAAAALTGASGALSIFGGIYDTYDPKKYKVTIHPAKDATSGAVNFYFQKYISDFLGDDPGNGVQLTAFAPGVALEASLTDDWVKTHLGVGGEVIRTFPSHVRGQITLNLVSHSKQSRALTRCFNSVINDRFRGVGDNFENNLSSPIKTIKVTADTPDAANALLLDGEDCFLVKIPTFTISNELTIASFVFDCSFMYANHGATLHKIF